MQLSRSRRLALLGVILLAVGLTGRASANTTSADHPKAAPAASAPAAAKPAPAKPAAAKPVVAARIAGPAGARMTTGSKGVALTFDDGPDPRLTPQILKLLADHHVRATFCLVGKNAQRHPELVRRIVAGGHTLCNHSWDHSMKLGKQPVPKIRADLQRTNDAIHRAAPNAKISYFRAPGGKFTPRLVGVAKQLGMTSIYWKVDPRDWDHAKKESHQQHQKRVIWRITKHTHQGAIILSHDYGQPDTIAAYRKLLPWLKKRYQLIPLP
jgi:peptidoglycan/xylan/chitin deacetylase (PgdA/CDA1 family)